MGSIDQRISKLEREAKGHFQTLVLEDGTKIRYEPEEMLDALSAAIAGEEHRLLPLVRREGPREGLAGLVNAIEASQARREDGDRGGA